MHFSTFKGQPCGLDHWYGLRRRGIQEKVLPPRLPASLRHYSGCCAPKGDTSGLCLEGGHWWEEYRWAGLISEVKFWRYFFSLLRSPLGSTKQKLGSRQKGRADFLAILPGTGDSHCFVHGPTYEPYGLSGGELKRLFSPRRSALLRYYSGLLYGKIATNQCFYRRALVRGRGIKNRG